MGCTKDDFTCTYTLCSVHKDLLAQPLIVQFTKMMFPNVINVISSIHYHHNGLVLYCNQGEP